MRLVWLCLLSIAYAQQPFIWPLPTTLSRGSTTLSVSSSLQFVSTQHQSPILDRAYARYLTLIWSTSGPAAQPLTPAFDITQVQVQVQSSDETLWEETVEEYTLSVGADGHTTITAMSVYGALKGLETFSQLIYKTDTNSYVLPDAPWSISDNPRFPHRGILIDTSRHFFPLPSIYRTLDAMSYNKLNVLHWHTVDSQSFPIESKEFPELARGAYSANEIYSQENVTAIIAYAKDRGIRVIPEFDMPGHSGLAWYSAFPDLVVCANKLPWRTYCYQPPCGQLTPIAPETYTMLGKLIPEMASLFPDSHFHTGADEVNFPCWGNDPVIAAYMAQHGVNQTQLLGMFQSNVADIVHGAGKTHMMWEESVLTHNLPIAKERTVIQAWLGASSVSRLANSGYQVIASPYTAWYLDCGTGGWLNGGLSWCDPYKTWQTIYDYNPLLNVDPSAQANVLGGEVCAWAETIDETNIDAKLWPRSCAAAERLWSVNIGSSALALNRINAQRELLVRRGLKAYPLQMQWCVLNPNQCL